MLGSNDAIAQAGREKLRNAASEVGARIRAAEYVRMSTEHQRYSTANQSRAIREYADHRGIDIVETYCDSGRSGLNLDRRYALKQLLSDVESRRAAFQLILVYDVSRWGRFQDADESAYYEFQCRRAGIAIEYCAEQFENDGSPVSTIVKGVKRAMAGEYSRELSAKVARGQAHLARLGYRLGATAGFGLRRQLVDEAGRVKGLLANGERKSIQTDRVLLIAGPEHERETVRWIFRAFVDGMNETAIAEELNARGWRTDLDRAWTPFVVRSLLASEKYIGSLVWGRRSVRLGQKMIWRPDAQWVRVEDALEAIVDRELFDGARERFAKRGRCQSNEELLEYLSALLKKHGYLNEGLVNAGASRALAQVYRRRFGALTKAYELVGFRPAKSNRDFGARRRISVALRDRVDDMAAGVERAGGRVERLSKARFRVNGEFGVAVIVLPCIRTRSGPRWYLRAGSDRAADIVLVVRMDEANSAVRDYYMIPGSDIGTGQVMFRPSNGAAFETYRCDELSRLYELAARTAIANGP